MQKLKIELLYDPAILYLNIGFWLVCFFFDIDYEVLWRMS